MDPIHVVRLEIKSWNPYCSKCCWKGGRWGGKIILGAGSYTAPICRLLQCESSRRSSQTLIRSNAHTLPYQRQVGDAWKSAWHILFEDFKSLLYVVTLLWHLKPTQDINEPSRFVYARLSSWRVESSSQAVKCHPCFSFFVSSQQAGVRGAWRQTMSVEKGTQWKSKSPKSDRWSKDVIDNVK